MRSQLADDGFSTIALIFDGLVVLERPGVALRLERLEARIALQTSFALKVAEKPLYDTSSWPTLSV